MADVAKLFYQAQPGTTDTLLYTNSSGVASVVRNIHVANTTGTAATITLGINTGAAMVAAEHYLSAMSVAANSTYDWSGFAVISIGETIRALQGTASALTVSISGVEQ